MPTGFRYDRFQLATTNDGLRQSQERRKVEEQYVAALRKLLVFKVPNAATELGFVTPLLLAALD